MKIRIISLFAAVAVTLISASASAATGKAVLSHLEFGYSDFNNRGDTTIYISNVTTDNTTVTLTLFNNAGAVITDGDASSSTGPLKLYGTFSSYQESPSGGGSVQFLLGAHQSARLLLYENTSSSYTNGYGRIEWTQATDNSTALVAHAKYNYKFAGQWSVSGVMINSGSPF
jgi:hypothetical protein